MVASRLPMDPGQALADLDEISSHVEAAVLLDGRGNVSGTTLADEERANELARRVRALLDAADRVRGGVTQLAAVTPAGGVFAVRDGETTIAATTPPRPTVGLVFYDLKTCLHALRQPADDGDA